MLPYIVLRTFSVSILNIFGISWVHVLKWSRFGGTEMVCCDASWYTLFMILWLYRVHLKIPDFVGGKLSPGFF